MTAVNAEQQTFSEVQDMELFITDQAEWQQEHLAAWIFAVFAWLALALAAVGLYSVVSYSVAQRTNEFGIRIALGAGRGHVLRIVFGTTAVSVGGGITVGLAMALALNSVVQKWAQGNARDPWVLLAGTGLLVLVTVVACTLPARYASRVDPMTALRSAPRTE